MRLRPRSVQPENMTSKPLLSDRRLPNFLVIGAMKGGTTALFKLLCTRSDVYMPPLKEPDFFAIDRVWKNGIDWYADLFRDAGQALAVGEASTSYSKCTEFPGVAPRIAQLLPDVRLIYVLRHPIERAVSMYHHNVLMRRESAPIDEALRHRPMYLDASLYAMQLQQYLDVFDRSQLLVVKSEDLRSTPQQTLETVDAFLGLPPGHVYPDDGVHYATSSRRQETSMSLAISRSSWYPKLSGVVPAALRRGVRDLVTRRAPADITTATPSQATVDYLVQGLSPDLEKLQQILGPGFQPWSLE